MSLEDVECFLIKKAMTRFDGNVSQAAKALGLSRAPSTGACSDTGCNATCTADLAFAIRPFSIERSRLRRPASPASVTIGASS